LKNPDGEAVLDDIALHSENEKKQINDQLMAALENTERAVDFAIWENESEDPLETESADRDSKFLQPPDGFARREESAQTGEEETEEVEENTEKIEEKKADAPAKLPVGAEVIAERFASKITAPAISDNFPETQETGEETLLKISVARVKPNQFQSGKIKGGNEITELSQSIKELGRALERFAESWHDDKKTVGSGVDKRFPETTDGSTGELLSDISALIDKHRNRGISAQWRVKQMNQSALVAEITVDLLGRSSDSREDDE
jgi:hypothetical protein